MGKIFFTSDEQVGQKVYITGQSAHHLLNVLRIQIGQDIVLCDGNSTDYTAKLMAINKPLSLVFEISNPRASETEPPIPITLYQGLPKSGKMEWIIEKCVEAGVSKIVPVYTSRSQVKVKDAAKKTERYARIAESAASQCMRGIVPNIEHPLSLADAIAVSNLRGLCIVAYEKEHLHTIKSTLSATASKPVSLFIGPEGGFEDFEITILKEKISAITVRLGPRILRTETAGVVALTQILTLWE